MSLEPLTVWHGIGAAMAAYLILLARSARKQGELAQFLRSLLIVAALIGLIAGAVALTIMLDSPRY